MPIGQWQNHLQRRPAASCCFVDGAPTNEARSCLLYSVNLYQPDSVELMWRRDAAAGFVEERLMSASVGSPFKALCV